MVHRLAARLHEIRRSVWDARGLFIELKQNNTGCLVSPQLLQNVIDSTRQVRFTPGLHLLYTSGLVSAQLLHCRLHPPGDLHQVYAEVYTAPACVFPGPFVCVFSPTHPVRARRSPPGNASAPPHTHIPSAPPVFSRGSFSLYAGDRGSTAAVQLHPHHPPPIYISLTPA